jgi:protocatechuate 3,4-dioxygenase alpha subunit
MTHATASQTAGPYWHMIDFPDWADLLRADGPNAGAEGERIVLTGRITDGAGEVVPDAMVEIWQADPDGRYDTDFHGFGRCATDAEGRFRFTTIRPGAVAGPGNSTQAPHIVITIFARGLMQGLVTRAYFAGDPRLSEDPVLALVPQARRGTLLAEASGPGVWRLDIRLQGEGETVFMAV